MCGNSMRAWLDWIKLSSKVTGNHDPILAHRESTLEREMNGDVQTSGQPALHRDPQRLQAVWGWQRRSPSSPCASVAGMASRGNPPTLALIRRIKWWEQLLLSPRHRQ